MPSRDVRLPDRRRSVMPHVAVTTAAALNAENSFHKLKNVLLKIRQEPILNQRAVLPRVIDARQEHPENSSQLETDAGPLISVSEGEPQAPISDPKLPEDKLSPGYPPSYSRRGASSGPKKHGSAPLKRPSGGLVQSSQSMKPPSESRGPLPDPPPNQPTAEIKSVAEFWGPLPTFNNNPPLNELTAETKPTTSFVPLSSVPPVPPVPSTNTKGGPISALPGGGFEAFMKPSS